MFHSLPIIDAVPDSVLLLQFDGKMPNLAVMKMAKHFRAKGADVEVRQTCNLSNVSRMLGDPETVYGSLIFERSQPLAEKAKAEWPRIVLGGTGIDETIKLTDFGITEEVPDYQDYDYPHSMGYSQRGCRFKCSFCKVPKAEGGIKTSSSINSIWRGDPYPRNILLLDNDFFGDKAWPQKIEEMKEGKFKVCFSQGINARIIQDDQAAAMASVRYYDDQFKVRRIYTAWDNRKDETILFRGLERLVKHGIKPDHIMVYMLIGYWGGPQLTDDDLYRHKRLLDFGCRPYPMPYVRTNELVGFQRWIVGFGAFHKKVPWPEWVKANYRPENLGYS